MKDYVAHHYLYGELVEVMFLTRAYLTRRDVKRIKTMLADTGFYAIGERAVVFVEPGHKCVMIITENGIEPGDTI